MGLCNRGFGCLSDCCFVGISMNARKLAFFDIQTWDSIHRYQCYSPIYYVPLISVMCGGPVASLRDILLKMVPMVAMIN